MCNIHVSTSRKCHHLRFIIFLNYGIRKMKDAHYIVFQNKRKTRKLAIKGALIKRNVHAYTKRITFFTHRRVSLT